MTHSTEPQVLRQTGQSPNRLRGFTLIEVMIVVGIIGILAVVALPAYQESVKASRRADMQRALGEAEQFMRRYYSAQDTFEVDDLPASLKKSPREGSAAYNITLEDSALSTFTIKATRTGAQGSDRCGDLTIDETGARTQSGQDDGSGVSDCFKGS